MRMYSTRKTFAVAAAALATLALASTAASTARAEGPDLAAKCRESGEHLVCAAAGAPLEASSPETALELYGVACAKHPEHCLALVAYAQRLFKKRDAVHAALALEKGCDLKAARACATLGAELEEGERGLVADAGKAARFYDRACDLGSARSCIVLAVMVDDGRGARRDPARAARLRGKADAIEKPLPHPPASAAELAQSEAQCRKNQDASRCLAAGFAVQDTDAVKAEELFRVGCTVDKSSCALWGFAVERLRRDDAGRGLRILEEGCTGQSNGLACVVLADLNHAGYKSIPRNEQRAAELYEKACTLGDSIGCRATASRFRGVKNIPKADELRGRADALETDADKATLPFQEKWIKEAPLMVAREPYQRELDRRRAEWRTLAGRARARWDVRMQRLAQVDAGNQPAPLPPAPATDAEASATRTASIKRMAKTLFP
jgi:TPR repeat protein